MIVILVGPIDFWWNENWLTPAHLEFKEWRDRVSREFVEAGHLVYRPHEAFKGAWDERAQHVNDAAIAMADIMVNLTPPGIPAYGTAAEVQTATDSGCPVLHAPPGDYVEIQRYLTPLDDPYGDVGRKSYTR